MIPLSLLRKIERWMQDHLPALCARCGRLRFQKDLSQHLRTTGVVVGLCADCEREVYRPWETRK